MHLCDCTSVLNINRFNHPSTAFIRGSTPMNRHLSFLLNRRQHVEPLLGQLVRCGQLHEWGPCTRGARAASPPIVKPRFASLNKSNRSSRLRSASSNEHQATKPVVAKRKVALFVGYELFSLFDGAQGTEYRGLQFQKESPGLTVEDALQQAIFKAGGIIASNLGSPSKLGWSRSSRTDKSVHSLATVVSMKMECDIASFERDPCGIGIANTINSHLPPSIRVFSVQRVTKNFNARGECIRRTYVYHLPAHVLGISETGSLLPLEGKDAEIMKLLADAWSLFQGNHAFHNYTKRRLYRDSAYRRPTHNGGRESSSDSDDGGEREEEEGGEGLELQQAKLGERILEGDSRKHLSTVSAEQGESIGSEEVLKTPRGKVNVSWRPQRLESDPVTRRHFRFNETCEASDQLLRIVSHGGVPCVRLTVCGASFMLHQIRHMVGAAVAVAIGKIPLDLLEASLAAPTRVNLPLAPASSLVLMDAEFSPFRVSWDGKATVASKVTGDKLQLRGDGLELRRRFADETLLPAINELLQNEEWNAWKMDLDRLWMDNEECESVMTEYRAWRAAWKARRLEETLNPRKNGMSLEIDAS